MRAIPPVLLSIVLMSGCALKPYHVEVPQGNLVSREMMAQLKPGMTQEQVRFIMGTPVLNNALQKNVWVYYYRNSVAGEEIAEQSIRLTFRDDHLDKIEGESQFSEDDL